MSLDHLVTELPPGLRRGVATVPEDVEYPQPTSTHPQEEPVARMHRVGGGIQDSSITVIENPLVHVIENPSEYGCLGLLLSMHFNQQKFGRISLEDVLHIRVSGKNEIREFEKYNRVVIATGSGIVPYNFVATGSGLVLPCPSLLPYEIVFADTSDVAQFREELELAKEVGLEMDVRTALNGISMLLVRKVSAFRLEGERLLLPKDYASIALVGCE